MEVYFLRHGRALDREEWGEDDRLRPLTDEGIAGIKQEAKALRRLGVRVDRILTSPLVRARQTAEIVAQELGVCETLSEDGRLAPGLTGSTLGQILGENASLRALMFVGHEPDFSMAIGRLTGGTEVALKKGGAKLGKAETR